MGDSQIFTSTMLVLSILTSCFQLTLVAAMSPSPTTCAQTGESCYVSSNFISCCAATDKCQPNVGATVTATCLSGTSSCAQTGESCYVNSNFIACCSATDTCQLNAGDTITATCL